MNSSISLIAGCWIATYIVEIYCNLGIPQPPSPLFQSGVVLLGDKYLAQGDLYLVSIYVQYHSYSIVLCMLSVHGFAFTTALNAFLL